jgi:hypothetical protein
MNRLKTLIVMATLLLFSTGAFAGGVCTQTAVKCGPDAYQCNVTFTCVGSAADGNFTGATGMAFNAANLNTLNKYFLYNVCSDPGSPAPTASYSFTLSDIHRDILGGMGATRSTSATECFVPKIDTANSIYGATPWKTSMTLAITGNSQASAVTVLDFYFVRN